MAPKKKAPTTKESKENDKTTKAKKTTVGKKKENPCDVPVKVSAITKPMKDVWAQRFKGQDNKKTAEEDSKQDRGFTTHMLFCSLGCHS